MKVEIVSEGWKDTSIKLDGKALKNVKSFNFKVEACKTPTLTLELYAGKDNCLYDSGDRE